MQKYYLKRNDNTFSVSDDTYTATYVYDSANMLIQENNEEVGFIHTWTYDKSGNIQERKE